MIKGVDMKLLSATCLLPLLALPFITVAQTQEGASGQRGMISPNSVAVSTTFDGPGLQLVVSVTGQPYSADRIMEHNQTLSDGTHIKQKREVAREYRDSQGRTRTERQPFAESVLSAGLKGKIPLSVHIYDPVAGYSYTLDTQKHVAYRIAVTVRNPEHASIRTNPYAVPTGKNVLVHPIPGRDHKRESLGTETILGMEAVGTRVTMITKAGVEGNDRPLKRVCEHWQSEEMKITLLSKCSDPRMGESVTGVANLERSEPDPGLFQVPPDYTIVDEHAPFTVGFKVP